MPEAENNSDKEPIVYELWDDEDLRWIEVKCPTLELAAFLEAWCEKNPTVFRRRPFAAAWRGRTLAHPTHGRIDVNTADWYTRIA